MKICRQKVVHFQFHSLIYFFTSCLFEPGRHLPADPVPEQEERAHQRRSVHLLAVLFRVRLDQLWFGRVSRIQLARK